MNTRTPVPAPAAAPITNNAAEDYCEDHPVSTAPNIETVNEASLEYGVGIPSAPSTLPLNAREIELMRAKMQADSLCDQAMRAIELERDLTEKDAEIEDAHLSCIAAEEERELLRKNNLKNCLQVTALQESLLKAEADLATHQRALSILQNDYKAEYDALKAKLARYESAKLPEEPERLTMTRNLVGGGLATETVVAAHKYDTLRTFAAAQTVKDEKERDAKRYRYWRERHTGKFVLLLPAGIFRFDYIAPAVNQMPRKAEAVDAAIDAALKESKT